MQEPITSATTPSGRRRFKLLASSVALTMAAFGSLAGVTSGAAFAANTPVTTQPYTIGAGTGVTGVTVYTSSTTPGTSATWDVTFTTPSALTAGAASSNSVITLTVNGQLTGITSPLTVNVGDLSEGFAVSETGTATVTTGTPGSTTISIPLTTAGASAFMAGDQLLLSFTAPTPAAGTYTVSVATTANPAPTTSSSITFKTSAPAAPTASQTTNALSTSTTSITGSFGLTGAVLTSTATTDSISSVTLIACTLTSTATVGLTTADPCVNGAAGNINWTQSANGTGYGLTQNVNGSLTSLPVASAATNTSLTGVDADNVVITPAAGVAIPASANGLDSLNISANGITPSTPSSEGLVAMYTTKAGQTYWDATDGNTLTFGNAVSGITVTPSPATAATGSTWGVQFKTSSTGALSPNDTISITLPSAAKFSSNSSAVVQDTTSGAAQVFTSLPSGTAGTNSVTLTLSGISIGNGDTVNVSLFNVVNPAAGSYSGTTGVTVKTSKDVIASSNVTAFTITQQVVSSTNPIVTLSNSATGATGVTYTIAPFKAGSALVGGTDTLEVQAPAGTLLPTTGTLTDTTANTSQTITAVVNAGNDVTYRLASNVAAGDVVSLTLSGVTNPSAQSTTNTITLGVDNVSLNTTAAGGLGLTTSAPTFPAANTAGNYADGAIVNFGGTFYVFAGGHAFGIPSIAALKGIQAVDPATVLAAPAGAVVPTTAPAVGTTIVAYNNPTIYVVGTDGQLHGFATPEQFVGDGYDAAIVLTVPGTGGLTVGATAGSLGTAGNAAATMATGAIINSGGTFYVYAGGKAFGIPGPVALTTVLAGNFSTPITGTVTATNTGATPRNGTLVTYKSSVYVISGGYMFEFKGMKQLQADGFGGTPSIVIPNVGGLALVTTYSGS